MLSARKAPGCSVAGDSKCRLRRWSSKFQELQSSNARRIEAELRLHQAGVARRPDSLLDSALMSANLNVPVEIILLAWFSIGNEFLLELSKDPSGSDHGQT